MKKITSIYIFMLIMSGGLLVLNYYNKKACAGAKCHYQMICAGNSSIKATVCASDCNDSVVKQRAVAWFKMQCSNPSQPTGPVWDWKDCDVTL